MRTFTPVLAGTSRMGYARFLSANVVGALAWAVGLPVLGHYAAADPWLRYASYAVAGVFVAGSAVAGCRRPGSAVGALLRGSVRDVGRHTQPGHGDARTGHRLLDPARGRRGRGPARRRVVAGLPRRRRRAHRDTPAGRAAAARPSIDIRVEQPDTSPTSASPSPSRLLDETAADAAFVVQRKSYITVRVPGGRHPGVATLHARRAGAASTRRCSRSSTAGPPR